MNQPRQIQIQNYEEPDTVPWCKPIRLFQFIVVSVLFGLTCSTISKDSSITEIEAIALLALFSTFFIITLIDIISQCAGDPIPDTPMFLFGLLGTLFFAVTIIIFASRKAGILENTVLIVIMILCLVCSILFLLDIILIFLYGY